MEHITSIMLFAQIEVGEKQASDTIVFFPGLLVWEV
jgi:hypothetical protein